ncbi:hypothetical protein C8J57DRAFT_1526301 [Mycena rebaudengoi]|nr:hypothetical protein C8J57DRAFT_1526301 [Mycena rebaudengoi]
MQTQLQSISTEWPLILHICPLWLSRDPVTDSNLAEVHCPLRFKLQPDVEYELIAKVTGLGAMREDEIGHFITKIKIRDTTYMYNDLARNGEAVELGPLYLLEEYDPNTTYVVYLRRSKACTTSRSVAEIKADFEKLPVPVEKAPILILDDSDDDELAKCSWGHWSPTLPRTMITAAETLNWKSPEVLWYLARFVKRHHRSEGTNREYQFHWLEELIDWSVHEPLEDSLLQPSMILRTYYQSRDFCREISEITLKPNQPDIEHENAALSEIYSPEVIAHIAALLADFRESNPVINSYHDYCSGRGTKQRQREELDWMRSLHLIPSPEVECVLVEPQQQLLSHPNLAHIDLTERNHRVSAIGSVFLQLLAIQHEHGEPLDLNGGFVDHLIDGRVVHCAIDGTEALNAIEQLERYMGKFKVDHINYEASFKPPSFKRVWDAPEHVTGNASKGSDVGSVEHGYG